jgi:hypothetical protein
MYAIGEKRCNCSSFEIAILLIIGINYGVCRIVIKSVQKCTYFLFSLNRSFFRKSYQWWFFTRNTPNIFAPPSARRNFFLVRSPNLKSWNRPCVSFFDLKSTSTDQHRKKGARTAVQVVRFFTLIWLSKKRTIQRK